MQVMDFLSKKAIVTDLKSTKKEDVIKELVDVLINSGEIEKSCRNKQHIPFLAGYKSYNMHHTLVFVQIWRHFVLE